NRYGGTKPAAFRARCRAICELGAAPEENRHLGQPGQVASSDRIASVAGGVCGPDFASRADPARTGCPGAPGCRIRNAGSTGAAAQFHRKLSVSIGLTPLACLTESRAAYCR